MRRVWILLAVLLAAVVCTWLIRSRRSTDSPALAGDSSPPTATTTEAVSGTLLDAAPGSTATVDVHRVEMKEVPVDGPATLVVHCENRATHAPMANLSVAVFETGLGAHQPIGTAKTAEDGSAELSLPAGADFNVAIIGLDENTGHADRQLAPLVPGERRELTFEIATGIDLHWFGRVLAREDRNPISGARVTLASEPDTADLRVQPGEAGVPVVTPGADGRFELWFRSWQQNFVRVEAPGYGRAFVEVAEGHESPEVAKLVLLSRSASVHARLLDAKGAPVPAGSFRLEAENHDLRISDSGDLEDPREETSSWEGEADASGVCRVDDLPPNVPFSVTLLVNGTKVNRNPPRFSLRPGETREMDWQIGGGCELEGRALDEAGNPVADCTIWLAKASSNQPIYFDEVPQDLEIQHANTDAEGRFEFHDVGAGPWWIGPAPTRGRLEGPKPGALAALAQVVEVREGSTTQHVDLHLSQGLYIQGKVLDAAGNTASGVEVRVDMASAAWVWGASTGEDGRFVVGPLIPGRYSLFATRYIMSNSDRVEAAAGEEGVVLRIPESGILSGTVVDAKTGKPCRAVVTIAVPDPANLLDSGFGMMQTEGDGTFQVGELGAGVYALAARAGGGRIGILKSVVVRAGVETNDAVISLSPGATLRLRNADERQPTLFFVLAQGACVCGDQLSAGGVAETGVPAGRIVIQWGVEKRSVRRKELKISVGEEREVVLGGDH